MRGPDEGPVFSVRAEHVFEKVNGPVDVEHNGDGVSSPVLIQRSVEMQGLVPGKAMSHCEGSPAWPRHAGHGICLVKESRGRGGPGIVERRAGRGGRGEQCARPCTLLMLLQAALPLLGPGRVGIAKNQILLITIAGTLGAILGASLAGWSGQIALSVERGAYKSARQGHHEAGSRKL